MHLWIGTWKKCVSIGVFFATIAWRGVNAERYGKKKYRLFQPVLSYIFNIINSN